MTTNGTTPRGFAPLDPRMRTASSSALPQLQAVVFDVDGTLCLPQSWMFAEMRRQLGISKATDILDHILGLPDDEDLIVEPEVVAGETAGRSQRERAYAKIRAVEREAMGQMRPQEGLVELMDYLDGRGVRKAICTRNFDAPVEHLITNFIAGHIFYPIITRDFKPPKPSPAGILHIAEKLGVDVGGKGLIMVGDSLDDMTAGRRAGAVTVLLANSENEALRGHEHTDLSVDRLSDLIEILEAGLTTRDI
ncbi:hypothetical protein Dda_3212 [Drechslerella dactyloides]|uniref:Uncharacterized protein n=1 Tax=Drechslerella dactyloides TaxID=74499 RepID=A0AAD6NL19_DREDA|nr:hypothetical protein Dda_3212 [Drechslerella dactyloides]